MTSLTLPPVPAALVSAGVQSIFSFTKGEYPTTMECPACAGVGYLEGDCDHGSVPFGGVVELAAGSEEPEVVRREILPYGAHFDLAAPVGDWTPFRVPGQLWFLDNARRLHGLADWSEEGPTHFLPISLGSIVATCEVECVPILESDPLGHTRRFVYTRHPRTLMLLDRSLDDAATVIEDQRPYIDPEHTHAFVISNVERVS